MFCPVTLLLQLVDQALALGAYEQHLTGGTLQATRQLYEEEADDHGQGAHGEI